MTEPRLKRPEETTVGDHLHMVRRGGRGTGGRPVRVGEFQDASDAELAEAGWAKPPREKPTLAPPGPSVGQQVEAMRLDRELRVLDAELAIAQKDWKPPNQM